MTRAIWKGPFVEPVLLKKVQKMVASRKKSIIKTWSRRSTILPIFVGHTFAVHNGKKFISVIVSEEMVGFKLGAFAPTRTFYNHNLSAKK